MEDRPKILVVDDDLPILRLMENILREFGFSPMTSSTGAGAIARAREQRPDLMLVDLHMPGMDGKELITAFRREDGNASIPILILSGAPLSARQLDTLGADGALQKPFDLSTLISEIRRHLPAIAAP